MGARRTTAALAVAALCALVGAGSSAAAQPSIVVKSVDTHRFPAVVVTVQTPEPGPAPSAQRVPPLANFRTSAALSLVMMAGPE